ncbi:MAG: hypothetical protein WKF47_11565 [Geodermatophilaceae bacterium]
MIVATIGYRLIHNLGRIATVVGALGFTYLAIRMFSEYDVGALLGAKPFDIVTFMLAISLSAAWQLTYGPYVADYSRYLPRSTPARAPFLGDLPGQRDRVSVVDDHRGDRRGRRRSQPFWTRRSLSSAISPVAR